MLGLHVWLIFFKLYQRAKNWNFHLKSILVVSIEIFPSHFCMFSYNGVYFDGLKLSVSDIIASQKGSYGNKKQLYFGWDYNFIRSLCARIHLWAKMNTMGSPRYKKIRDPLYIMPRHCMVYIWWPLYGWHQILRKSLIGE